MTPRTSRFIAGLERSLRAHEVLADHRHLLLAVSGGADSVAMLLALNAIRKRWRFRITVAHLDHRLRGAAAEQDAAFVEALAKRLRLSCITGRSDVGRLARRKGISIEMAAREARYRFLARTAREADATAIATAHTADDQAETVLLRLARGSGAAGLGAIRRYGRLSDLGMKIPHSEIELVRPLLDSTRGDIEAFLQQQGQTWREDESNASPAFLRNRVRHEVLPLMAARLNPSIREGLRRTADILREEDAWLDTVASDILADCCGADGQLDRSELATWPLALLRRVLRKWLVAQGVPVEAVEFRLVERIGALVAESSGSRSISLAGGGRVMRRYGRLAVEDAPSVQIPFRVAVNLPGETLLLEQGLRVEVARSSGVVRERGGQPGRLPACASLSSVAVGRRKLYLRGVLPGDRMQPYGMRGTKKLQDILVDAKVPADQRGGIPVLECGGEIAWVPGYRIAHPFRVCDENARALHIRVERL